MKKYFFMAVAAIAALSSCSNYDEFEQNQTGNQGLVFTATMEGSEGTRAILATDKDNKKFAAWEAGDKISINGKTYSALTAGTTTTFKADDEVATGTTYTAYFPADLYNNDTPALPANVSETWVEGKFNMPMYATSKTTSLSFTNLCGVLKITVTKEQLESVKSITVSSTNCATSGAFSVDDNNAAVLTEVSETANTVTVTYTDAVNTDANGKVFYVAIPAQTYQNLSIAVSDGTTTKVMTTKANQSITVDRNKIYPITFADNAAPATTGTAKATIGGSEVDVNWVQLWENGPKFAEYNVGVSGDSPKPEDYGGYYAWGGSQDKVDDHNTGSDVLTGDTDTATKLWGENWRMPTQTEFEALLNSDNCTVNFITLKDADGNEVKDAEGNTVKGLLCTGKGAYASNSVFLPAAGYCYYGDVLDRGSSGLYWSSTPSGGDRACYLYFNSGGQGVYYYSRDVGYSVRAVLAK